MSISAKGRRGSAWPLALLLGALAPAARAAGAEAPAPALEWTRPLPLGAAWALERGIDLPEPFGVGVFMVTMRRDIEVTDVRVTLPGSEPASIGDVAAFDVRNDTTLLAAKLDAWVLPVLDVYLLAGHTWTDSRLTATVTIDRPLLPPVDLTATQDAAVGGPLLGGGATLVAGHGPWFVLVDGNYNYSWIDEIGGGIAAWFLSARTGWSGATGRSSWRAWLGGAYLVTGRTLTISGESPDLGGTVVVEVDQRPVHPATLQAGGSVGIGRRWEALLELGSNFDDAFVGVLSASLRF
jgi:hypothetical protein